MKRYIIIFIVFIISVFSANAQAEKKHMNEIKKNTDYIYGIGKGDSHSDAEEVASAELTEKVKTDVLTDESLKDAFAYILSNMHSKTQSIAFEDISYNVYVSCLYIKKADILPLFQNKSMTDTIVLINEIKKDSELNLKQDANKSENLVDNYTGNSSNNRAQDNTQNIEQLEFASSLQKKLLSPILLLETFSEVAAYLQKIPNYEVEYEAVKRYDRKIHAYWAVFDQKRKLVAFLDTNRHLDLLNKKNIIDKKYDNNPQVWIQLLEE